MSYTFRHAIRENVWTITAIAGGTGSGKTKSGMRLAQGLVGRDKRFAVIDTEQGRAGHYAPKPGAEPDFVDSFRFDVVDLAAPFRPSAYKEAVLAAAAAGYQAIVIDSMSHEHAGDGGLLDMHEAELDRIAGNDFAKRDRATMSAWIKPKGEHKDMMQALLQVRAHLILCFRAEEKVEMVKVDGKIQVRAKQTPTSKDGWVPICEKSIPYEATASFLMLYTNPGVPIPIKLQGQHRAFFPLDKPIDEECGRKLAEWSRGQKESSATASGEPTISVDQHSALIDELASISNGEARLKAQMAKSGIVVDRLINLTRPQYEKAMAWAAAAKTRK